MRGLTLSRGLHWGRQVQTRLIERAYAEMGEEYQHNQQNCREIYPGELRRSGMFNPIIMDNSSRCHLGHRRLVRGSGEDDPQNLFALSFLRKYENPLPCCRSSKYDAGQESRTGNPESSDVSSGRVLKIHAGERVFVFPKKRQGKKVLQSSSPLPRTSLLCPK